MVNDPNKNWLVEPPSVSSVDGTLHTTIRMVVSKHMVDGEEFTSRTMNGTIPGPTLRLKPGDTLIIDFYNNFVGEHEHVSRERQTYRHNRHSAPDETNLHFHGLHVSGELPSDDVLMVLKPGESYRYITKLPLDHMPGTHFMHPHRHGSTALQVGGGAAAAIIVEDTEEVLQQLPGPVVRAKEVLLMIQEMNYRDLMIMARQSYDPITRLIHPNTKDRRVNVLFRCKFYLVNGQLNPSVALVPNEWVRLRIIYNGWNEGDLRFRLPGCEMQLIAKDGIYLPILPRKIRRADLVNAARADIMVRCPFDKGSDSYEFVSNNWNKPLVNFRQRDSSPHGKETWPGGGPGSRRRLGRRRRRKRKGNGRLRAIHKPKPKSNTMNAAEANKAVAEEETVHQGDDESRHHKRFRTIQAQKLQNQDEQMQEIAPTRPQQDEEPPKLLDLVLAEPHDVDQGKAKERQPGKQRGSGNLKPQKPAGHQDGESSQAQEVRGTKPEKSRPANKPEARSAPGGEWGDSSLSIEPLVPKSVAMRFPPYLQDLRSASVTPGCSCTTDIQKLNFPKEKQYLHEAVKGAIVERILETAGHPYHQHVHPFQIISGATDMNDQRKNNENNNNNEEEEEAYYQVGDWHDTIEGNLVIRYQPRHSGLQMLHCHILPHEDTGMMSMEYIHPADDDSGGATCKCGNYPPRFVWSWFGGFLVVLVLVPSSSSTLVESGTANGQLSSCMKHALPQHYKIQAIVASLKAEISQARGSKRASLSPPASSLECCCPKSSLRPFILLPVMKRN